MRRQAYFAPLGKNNSGWHGCVLRDAEKQKWCGLLWFDSKPSRAGTKDSSENAQEFNLKFLGCDEMTEAVKNKSEAGSLCFHADPYGSAYGVTTRMLKRLAIFICMLFLFAIQVACNERGASSAPSTETADRYYEKIRLGGFTPDGKKLALTYCTHASICKTGIYDIAQKRFSELVPQNPDQIWTPGGFSSDGSRLAVSIRRKSEEGRHGQIGIFDFKTMKLVELTNSFSYKTAPSFSPNGKKIIFAQSNYERSSGKTRFSEWDIYEVDVNGKSEKQLTFFKFFEISSPAYLPDNRRFIFSGGVPSNYVSPSGEKGYKAYQKLNKDNDIFVLSPETKQELVPFFTNDDYSSFPAISSDGKKIIYTAKTNKLDEIKTRYTYDVFLLENNQHKRLTQLNSIVTNLVISPKGDWAAYVKQPHQRLHVREIELLHIESGHIEHLDPAK